MSAKPEAALPLAEAAKRLDISPELLRKRIYRGLAQGHKVGGRWYVVLQRESPLPDSKQDSSGHDPDNQDRLYETLIQSQRSEITFLREEVSRQREQWAEEARRKDIIIADLTRQRPPLPIMAQAEGVPAPLHPPVSPTRPWWKFWATS